MINLPLYPFRMLSERGKFYITNPNKPRYFIYFAHPKFNETAKEKQRETEKKREILRENEIYFKKVIKKY